MKEIGYFYAVKPVTSRFGNIVNIKIPYAGYEISIAFDDSCGRLNTLSRTDIRVFKNDVDVTDRFEKKGKIIYGNLKEVMRIINKIDKGE